MKLKGNEAVEWLQHEPMLLAVWREYFRRKHEKKKEGKVIDKTESDRLIDVTQQILYNEGFVFRFFEVENLMRTAVNRERQLLSGSHLVTLVNRLVRKYSKRIT
jgi:predicted Zn-dependent protease